jgi:hypothetical protein
MEWLALSGRLSGPRGKDLYTGDGCEAPQDRLFADDLDRHPIDTVGVRE